MKRPPSLIAVALIVATFVVMGTQSTLAGNASSTPTLFVSPNGSDDGRCGSAAPCRSLGRAYRVASGRTVVQVAAGTYGAQSITGDAPGTVTFKPAPKASASFTSVTIEGRHVVFAGTGRHSGFSFRSWMAMPGASDVTFRDVSANIFGIVGASKISIIGGQVGPWDSSSQGEDPQIKAASPTTLPPTDILISGVYFHDYTKKGDPSYHTDCLQFLSGQRVVIRNNTFARCSDTDLFIRSWARGPADRLSDFTIEHNVFGPTTVQSGYFDLQLADSQAAGYFCNSFTFRFNTVTGRGIVFDCSPPKHGDGGGVLYGNVLPIVGAWTCGQSSATGNPPAYAFNVYTDSKSSKCDSSESVERPLIIFSDLPVQVVGGRLRLTYTVVAPSRTSVSVRASARGKTLWELKSSAPATPHARSVLLPRDVSIATKRLCIVVGTPPLQRTACTAAPRR